MIPETSILRNIPWGIRTDDRIKLQAMAFAIDAIYLRHSWILNWATRCKRESFANTPHHERLELFLNLWSIIDQVDILRQLLSKLGHIPSINEFLKTAEISKLMRDKMDHLPEMVPNLAKKTKPSPPIYGAFSFGRFYLDQAGIDIENVEIYSITAGSFTHKTHYWPLPAPATAGKILEIPVGMFEFSVFDWTLDVSSMVRNLPLLVNVLSANLESALKEVAANENIDTAALLADHADALAIVLAGRIEDARNPN